MDEKKLITVITPTYNRAYILPQLYESLCRQFSNNFEWLIVDDGSTDNTREIVEQWMKDNKIHIRYIYQNNGGKHRAHNTGVNNCDSELIMICDSDDYLLDDAIEKVGKAWRNMEKMEFNVGGIVAYRGQFIEGKLVNSVGGWFPPNIDFTTFTEMYEQSPVFETTNIYRTDVLKEYPFPEIEGEQFFPELYIWRRIDEKYKIYILREVLEIVKYLEDGYTLGKKITVRDCPIAYSMFFWQSYCVNPSFFKKIVEYGKIRGLWMLHKDDRLMHLNIFWDILVLPVALVAKYRYK